ncbi:hypothetical protein D3C78_1101440 [compost metagenome]
MFRCDAISVSSSLRRVSIIDRGPCHVRRLVPTGLQVSLVEIINTERVIQPLEGKFRYLEWNEDRVYPVADCTVGQYWTDRERTTTDRDQTCLGHVRQVHMRLVHRFPIVREPILHQEQIVPRDVEHRLPAPLWRDHVVFFLRCTPCTALVPQPWWEAL